MEAIVFLLTLIFVSLVFAVCGKKGFRLLLSLAFTIVVLIWVVTPLIISGYDPELIILLAGLPVLCCAVYLTEGWTTLSHISVIAVAFNFLLVSALAHVAVFAAGLSGIVSTDDSFLGLAGINLPELLVAGIMLGTLGILTEMVVTQVATVIELAEANPALSSKEIITRSYSVGVAHLGSIINTLFLVYVGVSLPLLIIYVGDNSSLGNALNYEPIVSEIIRTLAGVIGLIIAMPTSTFFATWWLKGRVENK